MGPVKDIQFEKIGLHTNIDYLNDFCEYKEILIIGLSKNKPSVMNIFAQWNAQLFPSSAVMVKRESAGFKATLRALMAEDGDGTETVVKMEK
jgi:hypothetical protein